MYKILVRDKDLKLQGEFTEFSKFDGIIRFNDIGNWTLEAPPDNPMMKLLKQLWADGGRGLVGIALVKDDQLVMAGPVRNFTQRKEDDGRKTMIAVGNCDKYYLHTRLALPSPYKPPYSDGTANGAYDKRSGTAEDVMRAYVNQNIGIAADPPRQIPGFVLGTYQNGIGSVVNARARFDFLDQLLANIASQGGGLGFDVVYDLQGSLKFNVFQPRDLSNTIIFSEELGNLASYEYTQEAPEANYVIAGGGGEGSSRTFVWSGDEPSRTLYGTIEQFIDQRQTSGDSTEQTELKQAVYQALQDKTEKTTLKFQPVETEAIQFGRDYKLGDKVTVVIEEDKIQDLVRSVEITIDKDGYVVVPTVGSESMTTRLTIFDKFLNLQARVGNLERR